VPAVAMRGEVQNAPPGGSGVSGAARGHIITPSMARRKKSRPMRVGFLPCQAMVTSGPSWASMTCRM
jgi:hypothetical protein